LIRDLVHNGIPPSSKIDCHLLVIGSEFINGNSLVSSCEITVESCESVNIIWSELFRGKLNIRSNNRFTRSSIKPRMPCNNSETLNWTCPSKVRMTRNDTSSHHSNSSNVPCSDN
jgi:hypothetical protein